MSKSRSNFFLTACVLAAFAFLTCGCAGMNNLAISGGGDAEAAVDTHGRNMDRLSRVLEEYGYITISTPILVKPEADAFTFSVKMGPEDYFQAARTEVHGTSESLDRIAWGLLLAAQIKADPTKMTAYNLNLEDYLGSRQRQQTSQKLSDEAARLEYLSATAEARKLTDASARQKALSQAMHTYSDSLAASLGSVPVSDSYTATATSNLYTPNADIWKQARTQVTESLAAGGASSNYTPTVSPRSALVTAAGDTVVEAIFKVLGSPQAAQKYKGKHCLFGVAVVSVAPGWRTQKDFAADLAVAVELLYQPARQEVARKFLEKCTPSNKFLPDEVKKYLEYSHGIGSADHPVGSPTCTWLPDWLILREKSRYVPLVAAVSPLTEVETLDLSHQWARESQMAMDIAGVLTSAGLSAQAKVFLGWARSRQAQFESREPVARVSAFSQGHLFGYQIGPNFMAKQDASSPKSGPGEVLSRQSFPVLIIIGLDDEDLAPKIAMDGTGQNAKCYVAEPHISFTQTPKWMPLTQKASEHRISEADLLYASKCLTDSKDQLPGQYDSLATLAQYRTDEIKARVFGAFAQLPFPRELVRLPEEPSQPSPAPMLALASPSHVTLAVNAKGKPVPKKIKLVLLGENLEGATVEALTPNAVVTEKFKPVAGALVGAITVSEANGPVVLAGIIHDKDGKAIKYQVLAPVITVGLEKPATSQGGTVKAQASPKKS